MAKITPAPRGERAKVIVKTKAENVKKEPTQGHKWWLARSQRDLCNQVLETAGYLKQNQQYRYRQAAIFARLYGNRPLFNFMGSNMGKDLGSNNLPIDRPTMNIVQSCTDTLVSRITQAKPRPMFLTDNANYKERNLAKQMNSFINGELYQTDAYELGALQLRDAAVLGTGILKVYENTDKRVALDRVLAPELLVDPNDAYYGRPMQLFQVKLIDRAVLADMMPESKSVVANAEQAFPDNSADSSKTISDQVIVVEAWRLPSGNESGDGRHVIACTSGVILDEEYKKKRFPFTFLHYSPQLVGFWGQGLSEQLLGTQVEINKLLMTISSAINLVGVPRVFVEDGSKIVKAHLNNQVGAIVTYRGTKPIYEVAPCIPQEVYAQLERLVQYGYQQCGISSLSAGAKKPAGLNSGEAIRNYDDLQNDRFSALERCYRDSYIDLSYLITDFAKDIAERDGKYSTVYPNKDGTKEIDLPHADMLKDPVIQCFDTSFLPREPSGRMEKVTEYMQAGMLSPQEGRRLLDWPDLEQVDKLANAAEERILQVLDDIVESGKYVPPDPFMDLALAEELSKQYYNLYVPAKLEESKAQQLRDFFTQIQDLKMAAMPPPPPGPAMGAAGGAMPAAGDPLAVPGAPPVSDLLPTIPQQGV